MAQCKEITKADEANKYLIKWYDEYLEAAILAGPLTMIEIIEKKRLVMTSSICDKLGCSIEKAMDLYEKALNAEIIEDSCIICLHDLGGTITYGSGYDERYFIVSHPYQ